MSEKTRSIKTKDLSDEEARDYLEKIRNSLTQIKKLKGQRAAINAEINNLDAKKEKLNDQLNDGLMITLYNYMDGDSKEIVWKDENGNEVERTPFDEEDWKLYYDSVGGPLFQDDVQPTTGPLPPELPASEEDIIDAEAEEMPQEDFPEGNDPDNLVGIIDKDPEEEPEE